MKLNLACGTAIMNGWINLDVIPMWPNSIRQCEVIWDARLDLLPFKDNTAEAIYAGYLLLHLPPKYHNQVLNECKRVLIPGGQFIVGEVDMDIVMRKYLETPEDPRLSELIWGEQANIIPDGYQDMFIEFDKHCQGFTEKTLILLLSEYGFVNFNKLKIHSEEVFYELTISCNKELNA